MSVSVIIPSKDRQKYLAEILPSYLSQTEVSEIIIVNDGSTDGTDAYLQQLAAHEPRIKYINNGVNKGVPAAKNIGIAQATGDYIFLGEDDLELTKGFFKTLLAHMQASGADLLCSRVVWRHYGESAQAALQRVDTASHGKPYVNKKTLTHMSGMNVGADMQTVISDNPALGRATLFHQIPFDEGYKVNFWREETDFQLSVQEAGYSLHVCPHAVCYNYIIPKDSGGVHAAAGMRRVYWVVVNNWRFIRKHKAFIATHFAIGSPYVYIIVFTLKRIRMEIIVPFLVRTKRRLLRQTAS